MARAFYTPIDLGQNELQNAKVQNLGSAPSSPVKGQLYYNSTGGNDTLYWWDGTTWQSAKGGSSFPGYGAVISEQSFGVTTDSGSATTVSRSDHTHGSPTHTAAAHSLIKLSDLAQPTAAIQMNAQRITGLADNPPVGTDAANKNYVDSVAQGLDAKASVRAATTANITLSAPQTIDTVSVIAGDRVLVKSNTAPAENGIYLVQAGAWTRAIDMDSWTEVPGAYTFVEEGGQADTGWLCSSNAGGTLGTTAVTWSPLPGAGALTAGAGLTKTANTIDVIGTSGGGLTVNADDMGVTWGGSGAAATAPLTGGGDLSANRTLAVNTFGSAQAGVVPLSGGGTVNFLRADGTWTTPAGGGSMNKTAADCAAATSTVVSHTQGQDCTVSVYRKTTPWDEVDCDIEHTSATSVTVRFAVAPTAAQFRIVVTG
jgi:hypothetical protein